MAPHLDAEVNFAFASLLRRYVNNMSVFLPVDSGLCNSSVTDMLLASPVLAKGDEDQRREIRIASLSVFLPAASSEKYAELLQPRAGRGFSDACSFVARLAEAGVDVECTAVARPDVDIAEIEALAMALGARSFRARSWIG